MRHIEIAPVSDIYNGDIFNKREEKGQPDRRKRRLASAAMLWLALACLPGCSDNNSQEHKPVKTSGSDPREGWVRVTESSNSDTGGDEVRVSKVCEKNKKGELTGNMIYWGADESRQGGIAVVPDSPECTALMVPNPSASSR